MKPRENKESGTRGFDAILAGLSDSIELLSGMHLPKDRYDAVQRQVNILQSYLERNQPEPEVHSDDIRNSENDEILQALPSHQLTSLHIDKFKGFSNLSINCLMRINIFAGINNSGKSAVLEAIYLLLKQNDFTGLKEILKMRGKTAERRILSDSWIREQIPDSSISGTFADTPAAVDIHAISEDIAECDSASCLHSMEIRSSYGEISQKARIRFFTDREIVTDTDGAKSICRIIFANPFFLNEPQRCSELYIIRLWE